MKKFLLFILCLLPLIWIVFQALTGRSGPDPGKVIVLETGIWAFRFLLLTLLITPVRKYASYTGGLKYRRMLGLFVWFYASLHFVAVWTYLLGWKWSIFVEEFVERPYMAVGIIAWLLLLPLGVTSNRWAQRRLGRRWKLLHRLIYPIGVLVCVHFIWLVRSNYLEAFIYCGLMAALLVMRLPLRWRWVTSGNL